jgi:hypothetical protein
MPRQLLCTLFLLPFKYIVCALCFMGYVSASAPTVANLPDISVIAAAKYSFANHAKGVELSPAPELAQSLIV